MFPPPLFLCLLDFAWGCHFPFSLGRPEVLLFWLSSYEPSFEEGVAFLDFLPWIFSNFFPFCSGFFNLLLPFLLPIPLLATEICSVRRDVSGTWRVFSSPSLFVIWEEIAGVGLLICESLTCGLSFVLIDASSYESLFERRVRLVLGSAFRNQELGFVFLVARPF